MARFGFLCATSLLTFPLVGCASERPGQRGRAPRPGVQGDPSLREAAADPTGPSQPSSLLRRRDLGLDDLLRAAAELNPKIAAAREELGAAAGRTDQSRLYPNPALVLEAEEIPARDVGLGRGKGTIGLSQPLILGSRRRESVSAASAEEQVRLFRLEATQRAVLGDVRTAFGDALSLRDSALAHQELLVVARRTLEIARARFEARAVPEAEVIRAELEVHELELRLRRLGEERAALTARIRSLLGGVEIGLEQIGGEPLADPPAIDLEQLRQAVRERNPELAAARAEIEAADLRISAAQAERIPDVDLLLAFGQDAADEDIYEAGMRIPLPVFDRNQGRIREARHLAVKARRSADALTGDLEADLDEAFAAYSAARDEVRTFRERIVPATERSLAQVRESYEAGRTDLLNLLDAQRSNARARLSLVQSLRDASHAEARMWKLADIDHPAPSTEGERP